MNLNKKSSSVSFLLTFFFGPLGLLYSSIAGAIFLSLLCFLTYSTVIIPMICWIVSMALGANCVEKHNKNVDRLEGLFMNRH